MPPIKELFQWDLFACPVVVGLVVVVVAVVEGDIVVVTVGLDVVDSAGVVVAVG